MPTRTRLVLILLSAAVGTGGAALAQEAPDSSYRLRPERGYGQQVHVESDAEPTPARVSASLSDEEPAEPETGDRGQGTGLSTSPPLPLSLSLSPPHPLSPPRAGPEGNNYSERASSTLPAAADKPPLKLAPRSESGGRQLAKPAAAAGMGSLGTVAGALAVVLGLFVVVVWITRRVGPAGSAPLPKEAVELLGRTTVSGQHALQLVRVGSRLLLVALSPQGAATLTEITEPHEVERLTAICLRQRPGSSSATFAQTVVQLERESTGRSFVDQRRPASASAPGRPRSGARA
jgi:flagellar biogenesis protein FliO